MDPLKLKLINELMDHISTSQGGDLKSMLDEAKMAKEKPMNPLDEATKPKGLAIEKVSVLSKPKPEIEDLQKKPSPFGDSTASDSEPEMSDDELKELLAKYLR